MSTTIFKLKFKTWGGFKVFHGGTCLSSDGRNYVSSRKDHGRTRLQGSPTTYYSDLESGTGNAPGRDMEESRKTLESSWPTSQLRGQGETVGETHRRIVHSKETHSSSENNTTQTPERQGTSSPTRLKVRTVEDMLTVSLILHPVFFHQHPTGAPNTSFTPSLSDVHFSLLPLLSSLLRRPSFLFFWTPSFLGHKLILEPSSMSHGSSFSYTLSPMRFSFSFRQVLPRI